MLNLSLSLDSLGTFAAIIMGFGYVVYAYFLFQHRTRANATAWGLMCISASTFLVVEYIYGVPWNALKLGAVDAVIAFLIMGFAYSIGRMQHWSPHDKKLILWYLLLLAIYLIGDAVDRNSLVQNQFIPFLQIGIIIIYNITTIIEFIPIIRETWLKNEDELPYAWIIWTSSYLLYLYVRILEDVDVVNLVYPIVSILLHGSIAILTIGYVRKYLQEKSILLRKTEI